MPALFAEELAIDHRELVERHIAESFSHHRPVSFDDSLRRSQHSIRGRNSMPAVVRLSSDCGSSRLSSFGQIPGHEVIETSVRFLGVTRVDRHCEFRLQVDTAREQFVLQKRFSQFRDLRQQLLLDGKGAGAASGEKRRKGKCRNGACQQLTQQLAALKFPRRKMKFKLHRDDDVKTARERQAQLQDFIETVLAVYRTAPKRQVRCCVNSQCKVLKAVRAFLDIKDLGDDLPDWKSASHGSTSGDEVPILDTPPSTTSNPSPVSRAAIEAAEANDSPIPTRTSALCLDQLYTITEDTEHLHV
jgi:hypothetical protein